MEVQDCAFDSTEEVVSTTPVVAEMDFIKDFSPASPLTLFGANELAPEAMALQALHTIFASWVQTTGAPSVAYSPLVRP
jgi:hypothetical protein